MRLGLVCSETGRSGLAEARAVTPIRGFREVEKRLCHASNKAENLRGDVSVESGDQHRSATLLELRRHRTVDLGRYQRKRQVPQVSPAPKPLINKVSPRLSRPAFRASSRAMGIEPADVLP